MGDRFYDEDGAVDDCVEWLDSEYDESNLSSEGRNNKYEENFIKVKKGKRQEFAEYVAQQLMEPCDSETGLSHIEQAIDNVFLSVFEGYEDFAKYPGYDE